MEDSIDDSIHSFVDAHSSAAGAYGTYGLRTVRYAIYFPSKREATMALRMITEKAMGLVSKQYQAALGASLAQTGELPTHRLRMVGAEGMCDSI